MTLDLSLSSVFGIVIHHGWEKYHCSALFKKKTASDVRSEEPSKISDLARTFGERFYGRYRSAPLGDLGASEHKVAM